ncbi:hypothetical protein C8R45DRAFT_488157 [Mycena sanguinolenta]|nr:hypothetical protein C8R45DRAFT_488157 [Mycena sanguinolenta]
MTDGDANVDTMAQMALDEPIPLDQETFVNEAGAVENTDSTGAEMASDNREPPVSCAMADASLTGSAVTLNASDETLWTEDQLEDARLFDAALASVTRELEDTSVPVPMPLPSQLPSQSPSRNALSTTQSPALHAPPSPPLTNPITAPSPVSGSATAHQPSPSASEPIQQPYATSQTPQQTTVPFHPCDVQHPSRPAWPSPRFGPMFDGAKLKRQPYRLMHVHVVRGSELMRDEDLVKQDGSPQGSDLQLEPEPGPTSDARDGHDSTPRCDLEPALKPVHPGDVDEGGSNGQDSAPTRPLQLGDATGREDFVPTRDSEPAPPKAASMRASDGPLIEQEEAGPKRDSESISNCEPVRVGCNGYSPPPVSPTSDSTLGGTPPLDGTSAIIPLALVAAQASPMKDVMLCEDDEDDDDDLILLYPS